MDTARWSRRLTRPHRRQLTIDSWTYQVWRVGKRHTELGALEAGLQLHCLPRPSSPDDA